MTEEVKYSIDNSMVYAIEHNIPVNVLLEITYRCNLHCSHCYIADHVGSELSFSEITRILDQLAQENCMFLTLTGGEALVRVDFIDIIRYASAKGFALKVFSNGTLIDDCLARELAGFQPIEIGVSIYGADATTHDSITGTPGSFERSTRALRLLRERGVTTVLKCLLMRGNVAQIREIRALAWELGATPQFDPIVTPRNDGDRTPLQHGISDWDLYQIFSRENISLKGPSESVSGLSQSIICRAGRDGCSISPDGEIYPCVALPISLGNLRQNSFKEIWTGEKAAGLREFNFEDLYQCNSCPDLNYCTRCWGLAAVESVGHLGPSYLNCRIARTRHQLYVKQENDKSPGI